jgi:hypothetical protein
LIGGALFVFGLYLSELGKKGLHLALSAPKNCKSTVIFGEIMKFRRKPVKVQLFFREMALALHLK